MCVTLHCIIHTLNRSRPSKGAPIPLTGAETTNLGPRRAEPRERPRLFVMAPAPAAAAASARASLMLGDGSARLSLELRVAIGRVWMGCSKMSSSWTVPSGMPIGSVIEAEPSVGCTSLSPPSLLSSLDQRESLARDEQSVLGENELEDVEAEARRYAHL